MRVMLPVTMTVQRKLKRSVDPRNIAPVPNAWLANAEGETVDHIQILMTCPVVAVVLGEI